MRNVVRTAYAIEQIGLLYEVERKADDEQLGYEQRKELRLRLAMPILQKFIDGRYKIDTNMVENGQRPVALSRKNYLFCKNHDAAEDAAVMYTMMACCKVAGVNVEEWLTYFLGHVHEYDTDYSRDLAELLPYALEANGILKKSETLAASSENL